MEVNIDELIYHVRRLQPLNRERFIPMFDANYQQIEYLSRALWLRIVKFCVAVHRAPDLLSLFNGLL